MPSASISSGGSFRLAHSRHYAREALCPISAASRENTHGVITLADHFGSRRVSARAPNRRRSARVLPL